MAKEATIPVAKTALDLISKAETSASEYANYLKKLKTRLSRGRKGLESGAAIGKLLRTLLEDLQKFQSEPIHPQVERLIATLDEVLKKAQHFLQDDLATNLRSACAKAKIDFRVVPDGYGVGPFFVAVNIPKETASLSYARTIVEDKVPASPEEIAEVATALTTVLFEPALDNAKFRTELHEALRVGVARQNGRPSGSGLRLELPAAYREMTFIRGSSGAVRKRKAIVEGYTLPHFVVELKQFMQSDANVKSNRPFQLEPSVIEHTRNPKKSVFIPRDLHCGYGEGTYYQAIVLRGQ